MKRLSIVVVLTILLLGILACGISDLPSPLQTMDPSSLATLVDQQLQTQLPGLLPTATQTPPGQACQPQPPPPLSLSHPAGLAAAVPDSETVQLIDWDGIVIQTRDAAGLVFEDPEYLHVAGPISQGPMNLPVVYYALENGGWLKVNVQGSADPLLESPMTVAVTGAAGAPFIAYSNYDTAPTGWISFLYAGYLDSLTGAAPLLTRDEGDGYVFFPLAVRAPNGQAEGVWYTLSMYGIGNIIFPPHRGLYYLDLDTNQITAFLGSDVQFSALSPDQTWLAYRESGSSSQPGIHLRNMQTCVETYIPLDPSSSLGGGYVVFAPDNSKIAWIEASGDVMAVIDLRVRVATTTGAIVAESPMANLYGLAGGEELSWILPVGWIDDDHVVYEMALLDWSGSVLARAEADFHNPIPIAIGSEFMDFYYP
jgi:hypothetical protein